MSVFTLSVRLCNQTGVQTWLPGPTVCLHLVDIWQETSGNIKRGGALWSTRMRQVRGTGMRHWDLLPELRCGLVHQYKLRYTQVQSRPAPAHQYWHTNFDTLYQISPVCLSPQNPSDIGSPSLIVTKPSLLTHCLCNIYFFFNTIHLVRTYVELIGPFSLFFTFWHWSIIIYLFCTCETIQKKANMIHMKSEVYYNVSPAFLLLITKLRNMRCLVFSVTKTSLIKYNINQ